jgi:hypothetical protein
VSDAVSTVKHIVLQHLPVFRMWTGSGDSQVCMYISVCMYMYVCSCVCVCIVWIYVCVQAMKTPGMFVVYFHS